MGGRARQPPGRMAHVLNTGGGGWEKSEKAGVRSELGTDVIKHGRPAPVISRGGLAAGDLWGSFRSGPLGARP